MDVIPEEMTPDERLKRERGKRLKAARLAAGFRAATHASEEFGWGQSTYNSHENGTRTMSPTEAEKYAKAFAGRGVRITGQQIMYGDNDATTLEAALPSKVLPYIPILGKVAAGEFYEAGVVDQFEAKPKASPFPPDPRFPVDAQYDLEVVGTSLDRFARSGSFLRCVDIEKTGYGVRNRDLAIVHLSRNGHVETTAKRVRIRDGKTELCSESNDPRWKKAPIKLDRHDEIKIVAIVLYAYTPADTLED